jgi:hypothetical protein
MIHYFLKMELPKALNGCALFPKRPYVIANRDAPEQEWMTLTLDPPNTPLHDSAYPPKKSFGIGIGASREKLL